MRAEEPHAREIGVPGRSVDAATPRPGVRAHGEHALRGVAKTLALRRGATVGGGIRSLNRPRNFRGGILREALARYSHSCGAGAVLDALQLR